MITAQSLRSFLTSNFSLTPTEIADDTELFTGGILDSFSVVEVVLFIEKEENIKMDPRELVMDNLDSVSKVVRFCESRRVPSSAPALQA